MSQLSACNQSIIQHLCKALDIETKVVRARDLGCSGHRSEHLLQICHISGCDEYLSPQGSKEYLAEDGFERNNEISLLFQEYEPRIYEQYRTPEFVSHLSIIDVIANLGIKATKMYIGVE